MSSLRHFRFEASLSIFAFFFFCLSYLSYLEIIQVIFLGFQYFYISLRHILLCLLLGSYVENDNGFYCHRPNLIDEVEGVKFHLKSVGFH